MDENLDIKRRIIVVTVNNERGILARVAGMFAARGYNIDSLTVSAVDPDASTSLMTIVTQASTALSRQIRSQLYRLIPVISVRVLECRFETIEREILLVRVHAQGAERQESLRIAQAFEAKVIDTSLNAFVFELAKDPPTIDKFVALMRRLGVVEIVRSGAVSMERLED